ncbi:unnamed protein product [Sphagnum troendelagicum]|uniref:Secreted protein n=1 Tax=Sphagnum troendelagicum TaxID=128251 RepID=A0ABP0TN22_9BRYO
MGPINLFLQLYLQFACLIACRYQCTDSTMSHTCLITIQNSVLPSCGLCSEVSSCQHMLFVALLVSC